MLSRRMKNKLHKLEFEFEYNNELKRILPTKAIFKPYEENVIFSGLPTFHQILPNKVNILPQDFWVFIDEQARIYRWNKQDNSTE
jgi:hypothetical protein